MIEVEEDRVIWNQFKHVRSDLEDDYDVYYSKISFEFDRKEYENQLLRK